MNNQYFSREGLEKMKAELENRLNVLRPELAKRIQEAKELGDISENAEFDAARKDQEFNESRIEEIRSVLDNAVVVTGNTQSGVVGISSSIKAESKHGVQKFVIVGSTESNPTAGFISNESPLGKAFLGRKKGEKVEVLTPKGSMEYKIIEIN